VGWNYEVIQMVLLLNPITPTRMRRNQSRSHKTRIEKMAILYLVDL